MYISSAKTIICLGLMIAVSVISYSHAQTTGMGLTWSQALSPLTGVAMSLTEFSQSRHDTISQKITTLAHTLRIGTWTGSDYRDMVTVLQCLQIPFADGDQLSLALIEQLSGDIQADRQAIDRDIPSLLSLSANDMRVLLMKQRIESTTQKYNTMIEALTLSIANNRSISLQSLDRIIGKNRPLLTQLLADKRIVDTMISTSADRQQKIWMSKTSLGFTQSQMNGIIASYRQQMLTAMGSWLDKRISALSRSYKDIIPFTDYIDQEKQEFLTSYHTQINDRFAQRLGDVSTWSSYMQRLHETVWLMQQQFYQSWSLQCGLLTSMTHLQRANYRSIINDLNQSIATIPSSTIVSTSATSGSTITSTSLSPIFITSLNDFYANSYRHWLSWFALTVREQASLRKKAIRAERGQVNSLQSRLIEYRQASSLATKRSIRDSLLTSIDQIQKQWILSYKTQKSLDRILTELNATK